MRTLLKTELPEIAGGHNHNNHNHNNNHNNNHHHNNHNDPTDGIAKLNIIKTGLENGDSWATIGKNIGKYFADKYSFVNHFGK